MLALIFDLRTSIHLELIISVLLGRATTVVIKDFILCLTSIVNFFLQFEFFYFITKLPNCKMYIIVHTVGNFKVCTALPRPIC